MANKKHLEILEQGIEAWNEWRKQNPKVRPDLTKANLRNKNFQGVNFNNVNLSNSDLWSSDLRNVNLRNANLTSVDLSYCHLANADLRYANLSNAFLKNANCFKANLRNSILCNAILNRADLYEANLSYADLRKANIFIAQLDRANFTSANLSDATMMGALLVGTNFNKANLTGCKIYGTAAWNVKLAGAIQKDLIITREGESIITVDNLEVAQFIYLLLHNEKIRHIIDTITTKVVLILGRFTPERKAILDAIREELRKRNHIPVLFDFQIPDSRDITETVSTLAHMAKFIIADITDARSIPQELGAVVPDLLSVPVQPLLQEGKDEYGMFEHFKRYPWVLAIHRYRDLDDLMATLKEKVIAPAEAKVIEIRNK